MRAVNGRITCILSRMRLEGWELIMDEWSIYCLGWDWRDESCLWKNNLYTVWDETGGMRAVYRRMICILWGETGGMRVVYGWMICILPRLTLKVIRKVFSKTITQVLDGISGITKNIFVFHLKACERRNFGFCVFLRMYSMPGGRVSLYKPVFNGHNTHP